MADNEKSERKEEKEDHQDVEVSIFIPSQECPGRAGDLLD
jgi:hypothetical protein